MSDRDCQVCLNPSPTKDFLMANRFDLKSERVDGFEYINDYTFKS